MKPYSIVTWIVLLSVWVLPLAAQINLDSGLVAYYPFTDSSLLDASGNTNDALAFGPIDTTDRMGVAHQAYYFDGVDDYLEVANHPSLDSVQAYTLAFWMNIDAWYVRSGQWAAILAKSNDPSLLDPSYRFVLRRDRLFMGRDSCGQIPLPYDLEQDHWIFCALTYDQEKMNLFIDSTCVTGDSFLCAEAIVPNTYPLIIGRDDPGVSEYFHGSLDDLRIYNRALTKEEVLALYDGTTTGLTRLQPHISLDLFPNPAVGAFTVQTNTARIESLELFDLAGRSLPITPQLTPFNAQVKTDFQGIAMVRILTDQGMAIRKVLLQ